MSRVDFNSPRSVQLYHEAPRHRRKTASRTNDECIRQLRDLPCIIVITWTVWPERTTAIAARKMTKGRDDRRIMGLLLSGAIGGAHLDVVSPCMRFQ